MKVVQGGVELALMISTMLHSIAVGNLLPASVTTVCRHQSGSGNKLADRAASRL